MPVAVGSATRVAIAELLVARIPRAGAAYATSVECGLACTCTIRLPGRGAVAGRRLGAAHGSPRDPGDLDLAVLRRRHRPRQGACPGADADRRGLCATL